MKDYIREVHDLCICHNFSLAIAESCTAGRIASSISSLSNSSIYFKGGIIAYQNNIKIKHLDISPQLIEQETAVSREVVSMMAINICQKFGADFSLATSGYAGPNGGTSSNPVGVVYIAVANNKQEDVIVKRYFFKGNRLSIIKQATDEAVRLLCTEIKKIS